MVPGVWVSWLSAPADIRSSKKLDLYFVSVVVFVQER
jgi:hypothetical protein